jgi:hypothetical protein
MAIEGAAHLLPAGTDKRHLVLHLITAGITAEETDARIDLLNAA